MYKAADVSEEGRTRFNFVYMTTVLSAFINYSFNKFLLSFGRTFRIGRVLYTRGIYEIETVVCLKDRIVG